MNSIWSVADNQVVKVQPISLTPTFIDPEDQVEKHILQVTLYEI